MALPSEPVILSVQQIEQLNKSLATLRHDVNGDLALVVASAELIKLNPALIPRMLSTLMEQAPKIREKMDKFSVELETALRISRS